MEGLVIKSTGSRYWVELIDGQVVEARIKGKFRLQGIRTTNPLAVGDRVDVEGEQIVRIHERKNYIIRKASNLSKESHILAANVDQALLFVTLSQPQTPNEFVDRFLVTAKAYGVPVVLVVNKIDLLGEEDSVYLDAYCYLYRSLGYTVVATSLYNGDGVDSLRELMRNKISLLAGNSGVGKSTLVAAVEPGLDIRTGEISQSHHKGKHTTTFSTMYPLSQGGYIIDTPGIKGFGLIDIEDAELAHYFPEMMRFLPDCRFYNCSHTHEPHCAVVEAVKRGEIAYSRYESYLKIMDEDDKYRK